MEEQDIDSVGVVAAQMFGDMGAMSTRVRFVWMVGWARSAGLMSHVRQRIRVVH